MKKIKLSTTVVSTVILLILIFVGSFGLSPLSMIVEVAALIFGLLLLMIGAARYKTIGQPLLFILAMALLLNSLMLKDSLFFAPYLLFSIFNCIVSYPLSSNASSPRTNSSLHNSKSTKPDRRQAVDSGESQDRLNTPAHSTSTSSSSENTSYPASPIPPHAVKTSYNPGKYLASISSNQYHEPRCDWAKRIRRERQLWFKEKQDAWERGYRAHSCVQA